MTKLKVTLLYYTFYTMEIVPCSLGSLKTLSYWKLFLLLMILLFLHKRFSRFIAAGHGFFCFVFFSLVNRIYVKIILARKFSKVDKRKRTLNTHYYTQHKK